MLQFRNRIFTFFAGLTLIWVTVGKPLVILLKQFRFRMIDMLQKFLIIFPAVCRLFHLFPYNFFRWNHIERIFLRIRKHGRKNPVQVTGCPDPLPVTDRLPRKYISGISGKRFWGIFDHSGQNQFFFGSRQCHIQYAQFLSKIFPADPVRNLRPEHTVFFHSGLPGNLTDSKA